MIVISKKLKTVYSELEKLYEELYWANNERAPFIQNQIRILLKETYGD